MVFQLIIPAFFSLQNWKIVGMTKQKIKDMYFNLDVESVGR